MPKYLVTSGGLREEVEAPDAGEAAIRAVLAAWNRRPVVGVGPMITVVEVLGGPSHFATEHVDYLAGMRPARDREKRTD